MASAERPTTGATATDHAGRSLRTVQLVSFTVGNEEYGVDIMAVREIRAWSETTPLPNTPEVVRGVINMRGAIVPIFDLRARFGMPRTEPTKYNVVIIVSVASRIVGILVDAVSDIITINEDEIRPMPSMEQVSGLGFMEGLITVGERMVGLIGLERMFSGRMLEAADGASGKPMLPGPSETSGAAA
ncbi:MAG: chemotaxis protein CheW [Ferrovibrio sp.]|jgi:purine-binding chemotaxis protein CheW|uniref:chemotaxis protein CheW n=1 Tax=Ferrovibrio sp. TaxID=1917215 RepID=UPI00391D3A42